MNEQIDKPLVQSMENPVWRSDNSDGQKTEKKFLSIKMLLFLGGILLFLLLTLLSVYFQGKENLPVEEGSIFPKVVSLSPTPTLVLDEKTGNLKEGIDEAKKDLESLNLFDDSLHLPVVDELISL